MVDEILLVVPNYFRECVNSSKNYGWYFVLTETSKIEECLLINFE